MQAAPPYVPNNQSDSLLWEHHGRFPSWFNIIVEMTVSVKLNQEGKQPLYYHNEAIRLIARYVQWCCCLHLLMIVWLSVMFPVVFTLIFDWFFIFRPVPSLFLFYINNSFVDSCYSTMGMPNEDIWLIVVYVCMVLLLASMNDCVVWLSINVILFQFIIIHCFYIYIYNHGNASF